jgi:hypothetical protein
MREQNEAVRAIGRERQVPVYDLAAEMPDDLRIVKARRAIDVLLRVDGPGSGRFLRQLSLSPAYA